MLQQAAPDDFVIAAGVRHSVRDFLLATAELLGEPSKARTHLGWVPQTDFTALVAEMAEEDRRLEERDAMIRRAGYRIAAGHE
jgi:GDPmannose 4,6-dehydratase